MNIPITISRHTGTLEQNLKSLLKFLQDHPDVCCIHYHWPDLSGVFHVRILPTEHSLRLVREHRPLRAGAFSLIGFGQAASLPDNFRPGGVNSLWPDWRSIRRIEHGHASVLCSISEEVSGHTDIDASAPFLRCPRSMLEQVLSSLEQELQLSLLVGLELEFFLVDKKDREDADTGQEAEGYNYWSSTYAMRGSRGKCLQDCVRGLQAAGIYVEQFHAESARHSYEIATGPLPALAAIDTWYQSVEIVRRTATQHDLHATLLPKPFSKLFCVGQHVHVSIYSGGVKKDEDIHRLQDSFLAGVLGRLPLLCSYGMPTTESYMRHGLAFSEWVTRGTQNRGAPLREIDQGHWELKIVDGTANLYMVLATVAAAGMLGVQSSAPLTWSDNREFVSRLEDSEVVKELRLSAQLPATFEEALRACETDTMGLDTVLGPKILNFYNSVKRSERKYLASLTDKQRKCMYWENY